MKPIVLFIFIFITFIISFQTHAEQNVQNKLINGKIQVKVICKNDPDQTYALFLPSDYSSQKKWPVLYIFKPGGSALTPMKLFKEAAEKNKYILICSNNSQNGPYKPIEQAMKAVWDDSQRLLSIDLNRVYVGGFSGGARVSSWFKYAIKNKISGIISFGAGLSSHIKPENIYPADYFAAIGFADFNYKEVIALDRSLKKAGVLNRTLVFEGDHRWPPKEICTRAIEWMEIRAFKNGTKKKNNSVISSLYEKELNLARNFSSKNKVFQAYNTYEACEELFEGLIDVSIVKKEKILIVNNKKYKKFIKNEKKRLQKELLLLNQFYTVYVLAKKKKHSDPYLKKLKNKLPIRYLLKNSKDKDNIFLRSMAKRVLISVIMDSSSEGYKYLKKKEYSKAIFLFEISIKAGTNNPYIYYDLACIYLMLGKDKKAINTLDISIKKGFADMLSIKKNFIKLKDNKRYQKVIFNIKEKLNKN